MTTEEYVTAHYNEALSEYMKIGKSRGILITTLQRGANQYNIGKLAYLLNQKGFTVPRPSDEVMTIEQFREAELHDQFMRTSHSYEELVGIPDESIMKGLNDKKIGLLKEASFIHANKLDDDSIPADEMREYSLRILAIYKTELPAITAKIEYYQANGKLPEEKQVKTEIDPTSEIDLYKRIQTLRKNISRDKANPKRAQHVPKWEAELSTLTKQYDAIVNNKKASN
jgi:hypothetical protein